MTTQKKVLALLGTVIFILVVIGYFFDITSSLPFLRREVSIGSKYPSEKVLVSPKEECPEAWQERRYFGGTDHKLIYSNNEVYVQKEIPTKIAQECDLEVRVIYASDVLE